MSTAMNFSTKSFQPRAPDKGAFPLDHFGRKGQSDGTIFMDLLYITMHKRKEQPLSIGVFQNSPSLISSYVALSEEMQSLKN